MKLEETYSLMDVCLGKEPPDVLIKGSILVNVYTKELIPYTDIALKGKYIAYVGEWRYGESGIPLVLDAKGLYAMPGFIDGHTHFAYLMEPSEAIRYTIPTGTTTIITELMEIYPIAGLEGMIYFMELLGSQPIKFFFTVPAMVFTPSNRKGMPQKDLERLLELPHVLGLGESYWQGVLQERDLFVPNMLRVRISNKSLEGHSAGAKGERLMAYLATGIASCHEATNSKEAIERARAGLTVMIREGAVRRELEQIAGILSTIDTRKFVLSSDGVDPEELCEKGYMELLANKAISLGVDPITAIQMVTLNVAGHFHLDNWIGGIAPSRYADIVLSERIDPIKARYVISSGKVVAEDGRVIVHPNPIQVDSRLTCVPQVSKSFSREDFLLKAPQPETHTKALAIRMVTDLVTTMEAVELKQEEGRLRWEELSNLNLVAAIERRTDPNRFFVGLVSNFGLRGGAFACSAGWDTTDMIVLGRREEDMALAANRIFELMGGAVIVRDQKILWELPLPIFGIMSHLSMPKLKEAFQEMKAILKGLGVGFRDPLLSLVTLSTSAIPFFRICHEGYRDLKSGDTLGLLCP